MIRQQKSQQTSASSSTSKKVSKSERCAYQARECDQPPLDHYEYCLKHILEDKNAPYRPCGYAYPINNKRCLLPAARGDRKDIGYCNLHLWKTHKKRSHSMSKHVPPVTPEALLSGLSHYVRPVRDGTAKLENEELNNLSRTKPINPFVEADVTKVALNRTQMLECASESDSDVEAATLDNIWKGVNEESSDGESTDSQMDDHLKYARYYTPDEVVNITRYKLVKLQSLYQKQFDRLEHILKMKRRRYLIALKKEKETLSSISDQARTSAKEQKLYEKMKALNRYHKRSTSENLAHQLSMEKRAKEMAGSDYKPIQSPQCNFTEGGVRCTKVILPFTKYCFKHILEDSNQCLFKACGCEKSDITCHEPITGVGNNDTCILHVHLPQLPHLSLPESGDKLYVEAVAKAMDESELDASATESAFSTDNRDSDDLVNTNDEPNRNKGGGRGGGASTACYQGTNSRTSETSFETKLSLVSTEVSNDASTAQEVASDLPAQPYVREEPVDTLSSVDSGSSIVPKSRDQAAEDVMNTKSEIKLAETGTD